MYYFTTQDGARVEFASKRAAVKHAEARGAAEVISPGGRVVWRAGRSRAAAPQLDPGDSIRRTVRLDRQINAWITYHSRVTGEPVEQLIHQALARYCAGLPAPAPPPGA